MTEKNYSIDLRTHNGLWARLASWFVGGRLVTPEQGSQTGPVSASGSLGDSPVTDERILQISTVWRCVSLISTLTACRWTFSRLTARIIAPRSDWIIRWRGCYVIHLIRI